MRSTRLIAVMGLVFAATACVGERAAEPDALPWRTVADSSGDTIIVRTLGEVQTR